MDKRQKDEALAAEKLAQERKKMKESRVIIKVGKPAMARSQKEKMEGKKEEIKKLTLEEEYRLRYLEMA